MNAASAVKRGMCFILGLYVISCLHYMAIDIYYKLCVPTTWLGYILAPVRSMYPQCRVLYWVINNTHISYTRLIKNVRNVIMVSCEGITGSILKL